MTDRSKCRPRSTARTARGSSRRERPTPRKQIILDKQAASLDWCDRQACVSYALQSRRLQAGDVYPSGHGEADSEIRRDGAVGLTIRIPKFSEISTGRKRVQITPGSAVSFLPVEPPLAAATSPTSRSSSTVCPSASISSSTTITVSPLDRPRRPPARQHRDHGVAARGVAAVGPVENTVLVVELDIDRLGQTVEEDLELDLVAAVWPAGISTLARKRRPSPALSGPFCVQ